MCTSMLGQYRCSLLSNGQKGLACASCKEKHRCVLSPGVLELDEAGAAAGVWSFPLLVYAVPEGMVFWAAA